MSGLVESATALLSGSEVRLRTIAGNVSNISTSGFKRQMGFSEALGSAGSSFSPSATKVRPDLSEGRLSVTGNPLDIAISGSGFFRLRAGEEIVYSRQGQFRLDEGGMVTNAQGYVLQQAGGGDVMLDHAGVEILPDGTIIDGGRPVARIGLFMPAEAGALHALGGSLFAMADEAAHEVAEPALRQGLVEASNVSLGDEMVGMMAAIRQAETGARLIQVYDELIGRAISAFGQGGK